jgi:hypothetical protein
MPMRCQRRRPANPQGRAPQFDLFGSAPVDDPPLWRTLPEETRQMVTSLVARLILEHSQRDPRPTGTGATDDV